MCLATVEDVRELPEFKDKEVVAYKILSKYYTFTQPKRFITPFRDHICAVDEWLRADEIEIIARKDGHYDGEITGRYTSGFHAYLDKETAEAALDDSDGVVIEVKLRGIHSRGIDGTSWYNAERGLINIVASEMFIDGSQLEVAKL